MKYKGTEHSYEIAWVVRPYNKAIPPRVSLKDVAGDRTGEVKWAGFFEVREMSSNRDVIMVMQLCK